MSQVKIFWMGGVGVEYGQPRTLCFVIKRFVPVISKRHGQALATYVLKALRLQVSDCPVI